MKMTRSGKMQFGMDAPFAGKDGMPEKSSSKASVGSYDPVAATTVPDASSSIWIGQKPAVTGKRR